MKVALGLVLTHGFPAPTQFWDSYELMMERVRSGQANAVLPPEKRITDCTRIKVTSFPVDFARNEVCRGFLGRPGLEYLFFMDCDHVFPANCLEQLLLADKPVITARYHMRKPPFSPCAYVKHKTKDGPHCYQAIHYGKGVFEIERGGAGALLIRRDVLEAIEARIGPNWFRYQRGPEPPHDMSVSEDFWFYKQARLAGHTCWIDWDCEVKHLQEFAIDGTWHMQYLDKQLEEIRSMPAHEAQAVCESLVVCGLPDGITLEGHHVDPYQYQPGER